MKKAAKILIVACFATAVALFVIYDKSHSSGTNNSPPSIQAIKNEIVKVISPPTPCSEPIPYSIASIDPKFGMSKERLLTYINKATGVWSAAEGDELFKYSDVGDNADELKVNLIYDYRQQVTAELGKIGIVIKNDKTTYNILRTKYDALFVGYQNEKAALQAKIDLYNQDKTAYNNLVNYWNARGGAPYDQYQKLEQQRNALNAESAALKAEQDSFNTGVDTLNTVVNMMNQLGKELNLNVRTYNNVGSLTGEQFNEGEYVSDSSGQRINIYQYGDTNQLTRVLEHEFGHALGLQHVDDPKAVMYRLNEGENETLTKADITELKRVCGK